jgi:hypothetical protein
MDGLEAARRIARSARVMLTTSTSMSTPDG